MSEQVYKIEEGLQKEEFDQYLSFKLADEEYGVDILKVQEIKGWEGVTPIPNMPHYILGVMNLRGTVVPIVDLRRFFELETIPFSKTTVVIVVRVVDESEERTMGIVVDAVYDVHNLTKDELKPAPDFGGACNPESIKGLAMQETNMIIVLDIDHLINDGILSRIDTI